MVAIGLGLPAVVAGASSPGAPGSTAPAPPPCSGSLQALVDAAPPAGTVRLPACTSTEPLELSEPVRVEAAGTRIDGRGTLEHAVVVTADDVTLDGLEVVDVASPLQDGAIRAWDVDRFVLAGATVIGAAGACVSIARGTGSRIEGSTLRGCGQEGLHATEADGLAVTGNRIEDNNPANANDPEWEAGGAKVTRSRGVTFRANVVMDNRGPGIWCDIDCRDVQIRDNRVGHNDRAGIQVEVSEGAVVAGNIAWDNGWARSDWGWGAGILVSSSRSVRVEDNVLAWNADGIVIVSQERDDAPGPATGITTSGNVVAMHAGDEAFGVAWLEDWDGGLLDAAAGNGGAGDRFDFDTPEGGDRRFAWGDGLRRLDAFAATPGGRDAAYLSPEESAARLAAAGLPVVVPPGRESSTVAPRVLELALAALAALAVAGAGAALLVAVLVRRRRARPRAGPPADPPPADPPPADLPPADPPPADPPPEPPVDAPTLPPTGGTIDPTTLTDA
jgi:hypothetical protein